MTITVKVTTPDDKRATITRSDGVEYTVEPGSTGDFVIYAEASSITITEEAAETSATTRSGGGGHGDPDGNGR